MVSPDNVVPFPDVDKAKVVPRMSERWRRLCWGSFALGVAFFSVVMLGLTNAVSFDTRLVAGLVVLYFVYTFVLAACNTFLAANGFDDRQVALLGWIKRAMKLAPRQGASRPVVHHEQTAKKPREPLILETRLGAETTVWKIHAEREFHAEPYRAVEGGTKGVYVLRDYVDLLRAETRRARVSAGALAGALGGLSLLGLQLFRALLALQQMG